MLYGVVTRSSVARDSLVLQGRRSECAALDRLLEATQLGQSAVLVVRGEAGIGKTALLEYTAERSGGCRVLRAVGVESEMELPFAGLHQLCASLLEALERLPTPQQEALGTAFGLTSGARPDRFFVGLALLSLLSDAAEEQPLLGLVDDAQWLDQSSAQVLAFVARRLKAESIVLVFAERDPRGVDAFEGLPQLRVDGLSEADAGELLASAMRGPLDERVAERIVAETHGNPLALLELPRGLSPAELAGGFGLTAALPLPGRIEESFRQRAELLPADTQRLLLVAAAEPIGDPTLLWRAAARLGLGAGAAGPAEAAGLLTLGARVIFRHPLLRSAIYRAAPAEERRAAHEALAAATDPELDPDRRAWHRAQATLAPDEEVASELERSADRARARGGLAAAAAFLERAAALTPGPRRRARRELTAAQVKHEAGAPAEALKLLATADGRPLDELQRARLERLRAQVAFASRRGRDAPPLLLNAARHLEPLDAELARETYLEALAAAIFAGRLGSGRGVRDVAEAARCAPPAAQPTRTLDLLLDGLTTRFADGYAAGAAPLRRALDAVSQDEGHTEEDIRWLWLACRIAPDLWEDEKWHALATRQLQLARNAGALSVLPFAATYRAGVHVHAGEFAAAAALIEEADAITEATGNATLGYTSLVLAAWRGQEAQALEVIEASREDATERGEGRAIALAEYATAVLFNGLGRYQAARAAAQRACEHDDLGLFGWALVELIEAAARTGEPDLAREALEQLSERTQLSDTDWALGVEARSRALLAKGGRAEDLYCEATERLGRCRITVHLARTHLIYGEWLRRENRRTDARKPLRAAHEMFASMGAEAFAERAARELLATGDKARKRTPDTRGQLTAQETQIAELAREGHSNPEIGAQLFISPRTVEYHLHKVFTKLDISSRNELNRVLPSEAREVQPVSQAAGRG
jgi:DNA-binding CsgD family transcriptional regulator